MVDYTNITFPSGPVDGYYGRFFLDPKTKAIILPYYNDMMFPIGSTITVRVVSTQKPITMFTNIDDAAFHLSNHGLHHEAIHLLLLDWFDEETSRGLDKIITLISSKEGYEVVADL